MNIPTISSSPTSFALSSKAQRFGRITQFLFLIFSVYLVLPVVDVPLLGLSLSAPIFFLIAVEVLFRSNYAAENKYQPWKIFPFFIFLSVFISAVGNGLLSGGVNFDLRSFQYIIRYAYWLLVFFVTAVFVSRPTIGSKVVAALGWGVLVLALARWLEVFLYQNIGAWTGTYFLTQNSYGLLFSTFTPFLLAAAFNTKGRWRRMAMVANLVVWGAVAVNGSRGSWVSVFAGICVFLFVMVLARPRQAAGKLLLMALILSVFFGALLSSERIAGTVTNRFSTFDNLEEDKSFMVRVLMNQKALRLFQEAPIIGVGPGRFTKSSTELDIPEILAYKSQAQFDSKSAHNSYLSFLAENGLFGAIPFGLLLLNLGFGGLRSAIILYKRGAIWGAGIFASFVGMSIHMWTISSLSNTAAWFIYGMAAALIVTARSSFFGKYPPAPV